MTLSQPSQIDPDPLSAVLTGLGARATRPSQLEAAGEWSLAFPPAERLKFVAVLRGACWFRSANDAPYCVAAGDVVLIGKAGYVVASDPSVRPSDGPSSYAAGDRLRLGGSDTMLLGGGVEFTPGTSAFLLDMLPASFRIEALAPTARVVAAVLGLLHCEAREPGLGGDAASARLAELLVLEAIRSQAGATGAGWLGALADPRIGRALRSFHANVARPWTVASLAAEAGMSRAAFSTAFGRLIGRSPLGYARAWRLTLARARLAGGASVSDVAAGAGYASQSAFGHAFRRTFGSTPGGSLKR